MKQRLLLLALCALFSLTTGFGQEEINLEINPKLLKEGDNVIKKVDNMVIHATVKDKKVTRLYGVEKGTGKEIEFQLEPQAASLAPAPPTGGGSPGGSDTPPPTLCLRCPCLEWVGTVCLRRGCYESPCNDKRKRQ